MPDMNTPLVRSPPILLKIAETSGNPSGNIRLFLLILSIFPTFRSAIFRSTCSACPAEMMHQINARGKFRHGLKALGGSDSGGLMSRSRLSPVAIPGRRARDYEAAGQGFEGDAKRLACPVMHASIVRAAPGSVNQTRGPSRRFIDASGGDPCADPPCLGTNPWNHPSDHTASSFPFGSAK